VDHIDHICDLVGPKYVGLGSDFDGIGRTPVGLEDVSKMPNITRELVKREYSDADILKILGGNHLRVFKDVLK
jgi:membrane dipeptidase